MIGNPVPVQITFKNEEISCPDETTVNWKEGPDSVLWTFGELEQKVAYVEVEFKQGSPFSKMPVGRAGGILGTGNTGKGGTYEYTVRVYNAQGGVVAELDPRIINDPR
jgi:hypothetical protein